MAYNPNDFINVILAGFDTRISAKENGTATPTPTPAATAPPSSSATFTATQLTSRRVYQRATTTGGAMNKGVGTIDQPVNVTALGTPYYRLRSEDGSTVLKDWTAAPTFTATGAQTLTLPSVDARLGWVLVDLSGNGSTPQLGTSPVGMGRVVAAAGQSLAVRMFGRMDSQTTTMSSLGVTISPNSSVYGTYSDSQRSVSSPAWAIPADASNYDSAFTGEFLRLQVAAAGVNCGLVAANPVGGQSITTFIPGGGNNSGLRARLNEVGGFETFIWMQGHSDVGGDTAAYQSNLSTLFTDVTARNGVRGSSYDRLVNDLPNITSGSYPTPAARQALHVAVAAWCTNNGATYVQPRDLDLIDGIHQSMIGSIALARHFHRASRPGLGLSRSNAGATFGTPTRSGVTITIPVSLPSGATSLSAVGSPANRFSVYPAGTISGAVSLDATTPITVGATSITLKLAAVPADTTALDIYFGYPSDPNKAGAADMIYDNSVDGDGITLGRHLMPNLSPAVVAAVSAGAPSKIGADLTPTSMTYTDSASGFGTQRSGGYASSITSGDTIPETNTWTIEGFITCDGVGTPKVAFGQSNKAWVGVATNGQLIVNVQGPNYLGGGSNAGSGTLPVINDGVRRHIAVVANAGSVTLYVNGVSIATATGAVSAAGGSVFNIGTFLSSGSTYLWTGKVDEVAVWPTAAYTSAFTPRTTPYAGTEGMSSLWHLDGNADAASTGGTTTTPVSGKIGADLTPTGMTYATGASGYGQERTGGYAAAAADGDTISSSNTWTVEGIISISANPSSVRACFGQANKVWVGCATTGQLIVNAQGPNYLNGTGNTGGGSMPVIADGLRHHVEVSCAAGVLSVFLDGAMIFSVGGASNGTAGGRWNIGTFLSSNTYAWPGTVDEVAVWPIARHSAAFTPRTTPYAGSEGMSSLWHLDGNANAAVV